MIPPNYHKFAGRSPIEHMAEPALEYNMTRDQPWCLACMIASSQPRGSQRCRSYTEQLTDWSIIRFERELTVVSHAGVLSPSPALSIHQSRPVIAVSANRCFS